ncbi:coiled-coil domain-containing protein 89 [Microcaecilia unicolor]|uniref:Coiled-coil domain-containing protein 89 n=1 Tax=Microcaecilia unicolor TaxID=1415580 RepID=A0A6P7XKC9_9AMPH|nr:coiled-coil domain-containing protein 89 [Microcaecilia unicolor]
MQAEQAVLRSRIDEQSQLICALKRRADQTLERCQALEALNEEREAMRQAAEAAREAEEHRARQLEDRFEDLAANHQMMIRFKDEYKRQSAELWQECGRLRRELDGDASREREEQFNQLQEEKKEWARALQERDKLLGQVKEVSEAQDVALREREERIGKLEEELRRLSMEAEEQRTRAEERRREETGDLRNQLQRMSQEKDELLQLSMSRGRLIQDKQQQVARLQDEMRTAAEERRRAEIQGKEDGPLILALQQRLREAEHRQHEAEHAQVRLQREFSAYKQHSADLLAKERALNAKLRHVIG